MRREPAYAQRVAIALKLEETLAPEAKERQRRGLKRGAESPVPQKSAERGETRNRVAEAAGVSHDTVSKVKRVLRDGDEETKTAMLNGTVSIGEPLAHRALIVY